METEKRDVKQATDKGIESPTLVIFLDGTQNVESDRSLLQDAELPELNAGRMIWPNLGFIKITYNA